MEWCGVWGRDIKMKRKMELLNSSCLILLLLFHTLGSGSARAPSAPQVRIQPRYIEAVVGDPAEFFCIVEANPTPRISWLR